MKKRELRIFLFFTFLILLSFKQIYSQEEEEKEEIEIYDKASNNPSQESNSYHDHEFPHPDPVFVKEEHYPQFITKKSGSNIGAWEQSINVADFLSLGKIEYVSLPISINIILIGFEGNGNGELRISEQEFKPWFEHFESVLKHNVVPVGEEQTTTQKIQTPTTKVNYDFNLHVFKLSPMLNTILEDIIEWNMRPEKVMVETESEFEVFYVDAFRFSSVIENLLEFLNLTDSFSFLILNPTSSLNKNQIYGYRTGFSDTEIRSLQKHPQLSISSVPPNFRFDDSIKFQPRETSNSKLQFQDLTKHSEQWIQWYLTTQTKGRTQEEIAKCLKSSEEENSDCVLASSISSISQLNIVDLAKHIINNGTDREKEYLYKVHQGYILNEECLVDLWVSHGRFVFIDLTAGPFEWGPSLSGEGVRTRFTLPSIPKKNQLIEEKNKPIVGKPVEPSSQDRYSQYQGEITILKAYWETYCSLLEAQSSDLCVELKSRIDELKNTKTKTSDSWKPLFGADEEEGKDMSLILDNFLSQLGAIISSGIHHLVVPPTPLFQTYYNKRIIFQIFIIKDHNEYNPTGLGYFDFTLFQQEILKLKLPSQEFSFTLKEFSFYRVSNVELKENSILGLAFYNSLRAMIMPVSRTELGISSETYVYLDSKELRHYLQIFESHNPSTITREIPIFLFSLKSKDPVLIDKYYQSKALSNMIIGVQSNISEFETRISCNHEPFIWDLRNPLKALLSSVALLVGGIVPSHISYSTGRQSATQNWLWAAGDSPASFLSSRFHFSKFHRDIAFRHYLVQALNYSVSIVNKATAKLSNYPTTLENSQAIDLLPFNQFGETISKIKTLWNYIGRESRELNYTVVEELDKLQSLSLKIEELSSEIAEGLEVFKCVKGEIQRTSSFFGSWFSFSSSYDWMLPFSFAFNLLVVLLVILLKRKTPKKLKIN